MGFVGLQVVKKMKQTITKYFFEGLWGSVGFVVVCGFYSHPNCPVTYNLLEMTDMGCFGFP